jgi:hypothetical protein
MALFLIDPQEKLDFTHDWSGFLAEGDAIISRQWAISPLNGTSPESPILSEATAEDVMVEACQAGKVYKLTESIVTAAGIRSDRTIVLRCEDQ